MTTATKTPCTLEVKYYPSNVSIFVRTQNEDENAEPPFFGELRQDIDWLNDEDKDFSREGTRLLEKCETVEEVEEFVEKYVEYGIVRNCIAYDNR